MSHRDHPYRLRGPNPHPSHQGYPGPGNIHYGQGGYPPFSLQYPNYLDDTYYPNIQAQFYAEPYHSDWSEGSSPSAPPATDPTPVYLSISLKPSARLPAIASRKLLILDLNGTLLFRSPLKRKARPPPQPERTPLSTPESEDHQPGRLRTVHPRPYMGAFRAYLFAPQTRAWLDTMIWSSAQPHSVKDMVERCFGEDQDRLVAVWARDTLGLSSLEYRGCFVLSHQKSLTTKDLAKPWAELALSTSPNAPAQPRPVAARATSSPAVSPQAHSALTTLLLDDSPRKARLQPWNHVCIAEYAGGMRARDLEVLNAERKARMQRKGRSEDTEMNEGKMGVQGGKGKMQNKGKTAMSLEESSPPPPLSPQHPDGPGYDETLLGVIGILEAVKHESNVAGWIRAGGLWGRGRPTAVEEERMGHGLQDAGSKLAKKRKGGGKGNDAGEDPEMWFEDGATMDYWAGRGRAALGVLGVDIGAGIER